MKFLLADDHSLFRDGIRLILRPLAKNVHFLDSDSFQSTVDVLTGDRKVELLFLEYLIPGMNNVEGVREILHRFPETPVLIVSAVNDPAIMSAILETGVAGFFPKSQSASLFLGAVQLVLSGGRYIPEGIVRSDRKTPASKLGPLTQRQAQVLHFLCEGASNFEIAGTLNLSMPTVKMHVRNLFRLLGVSSRMKAVIRAKELGLLPEHPRPR